MNPYLIAGILFVIAATLGGTYAKGRLDGKAVVKAEWDADKAARIVADNKAIAARIAENAALATKHNAEKVKLKKGYENEIAKIRADSAVAAAGRLRLSTSICESFARGTKGDGASGSSTDPAGTVALPAAIDRNLRSLAQEADEAIAGCRAAQEFIKSQGMAP